MSKQGAKRSILISISLITLSYLFRSEYLFAIGGFLEFILVEVVFIFGAIFFLYVFMTFVFSGMYLISKNVPSEDEDQFERAASFLIFDELKKGNKPQDENEVQLESTKITRKKF